MTLSSNWIRVIVLGAALVCTALLLLSGERLKWDYAKPVGVAASIVVWIVMAFERWAWRWPVVRGLSNKPILHGTWRAELRSSYKARAEEAIPCFLVVRQTYSTIQVRAIFDRSASTSLACELTDRGGSWQLSYILLSLKHLLQADDNPSQRGAAVLSFDGSQAARLEGDYWMENGTHGRIATTGKSNKLYEHFETAASGSYV